MLKGHGVFDILFYRNKVNQVAFSLDDGDTVYTPQGRNIPITSAWTESDEDGLEVSLTAVQKDLLDKARQAPPLSELDQLTKTFSKRMAKAKKDYVQKVFIKEIPESVKVVFSDIKD